MTTYLIIGITVLVSYLCFKDQSLFYKLAMIPYRVVHNKEWYRAVSYGFVHADSMHLLVNMITFWSFGLFIESAFQQLGFGLSGYLGLYFGGLIVATLPDIIKHKNNSNYVSIGASGAVSAVLFASIFLNPWSKILILGILPVPGIVFGVLYLVYCQYMEKRGRDHVNHNAHFMGAVYGFVYPFIMKPSLINMFISHF